MGTRSLSSFFPISLDLLEATNKATIIWIGVAAVLLLAVLPWAIIKINAYLKFLKIIRQIPGKPGHWFYGNIAEITFHEDSITKNLEWRMENGYNTTKFWLGPFYTAVGIHHPDGVKNVLKCPKAESMYHMIEAWLGQGLLIANGDRWHRNRRLLTPAFHFDILKPYVYTYNEATDILLNKWEKTMKEGKSVKIHESFVRLTLDIILRCAFSHKSGCQEKDHDPYASAVIQLCKLSAARVVSPWKGNDFLYFNFMPEGWRHKSVLKVVHKQADSVIKQRKIELGLNTKEGSRKLQTEVFKMAKAAHKELDFLDVLLTAKDEDGRGLSDLEIRCEVDTFMFEGHDTTANGLTWCLYLLAKHPKHQQKCREEVQNVLRGRSHLEYDDLQELKYTQWCIKEAIRIYPPVYRIFRRLTEDTEVCGYTVPKGTHVGIGIIDIHRHPEVWKNPMEFDPMRFHPDNFSNRQPFEYIPFSAGPRNCIGQNFAMNEQLVVIGSILNKFSFELADKDHEVYATPIVILRPEKDIQILLKPL